jgi:hypothetical protein
MGCGERHVASPGGRYGSVHSTISENENTGIRIKDVRVLFIAGAPHQFSRLTSALFMYYLFSVISAGGCDCIRPCVRKKRQRKEQFGDVIARNGTWSAVIRRNPSLLGSKRI